MAGRKIDNATYLAVDWQDEIESKDILKIGSYNISFTNMSTTTEPEIAAGSSIDVDGVLYKFDTDETITGSPSDGTVYITITAGATAIAAFTNTALPDYDYVKKGYYGTSGERYVGEYTLDSTEWAFVAKIDSSYEVDKRVTNIVQQLKNFSYVSVASTEVPIGSPASAASGLFGYSTAVDGNYAAIGAPGEGNVYVNYCGGDNMHAWDNYESLTISSGATYNFGYSVAIDGDYLVVGAPDTTNGTVYVYHRTATNTWDSSPATLTYPTDSGADFGDRVDIDGDYIVVTAPYADTHGTNKGGVYVFHRTGTNTWDAGVSLTHSSFSVLGATSKDLAAKINGDYVIVPGRWGLVIFHRTGTNTWDTGWGYEQNESGSTPKAVDIYEDIALSYSVYWGFKIWERTATNTWSNTLTITEANMGVPATNSVISFKDGYFIIGSSSTDTGDDTYYGNMDFYKLNSSTDIERLFILKQPFTETRGSIDFGISADISDNNIIVGASAADYDGDTGSGKSFLYYYPQL